MKSSSLREHSRNSILDQTQFLMHGGHLPHKKQSELALALPLTSLIDAFSIIVIYLLIGTQGGGFEMPVPTKMNLPVAESSVNIDKETITVRIEKGHYFVNDKQVALSQLGTELATLRKGQTDEVTEIIIQADQKMDYADLDPLLRAGSEAGIQKLKFAVMPLK